VLLYGPAPRLLHFGQHVFGEPLRAALHQPRLGPTPKALERLARYLGRVDHAERVLGRPERDAQRVHQRRFASISAKLRIQAGRIHAQQRAVHIEEGGPAYQNERVVTRGGRLHDARPVAVRLDIRPRLTLPPERRAAPRRRFRLPPLALPAAGYWLAMGALTYTFAHWGSHPFDSAEASASPLSEPATLPASPSEPPTLRNEPATEPANLTAPDAAAANEPVAATEPPPATTETAPTVAQRTGERERERETRDNRRAGRREDIWGSRGQQNDVADEPKREEPARVAMSFPEFTDSSRSAKREHAADGPRIDSLFDKATERPSQDSQPDAPAPPETTPDAPVVVSSCEAAIARNNEQITIGAARGAADTTREAYAAILQNGHYLAACSVPERTVFEVCAAVKDGRAIGITVVSSPASPKLNACVRSAVSHLQFPRNSRLDVTHTRFDAAAH